MSFRNLPCRIVRRGSNHTDLVATLSEPFGHFRGIFPYPYLLRGIVNAMDKNAHKSPFLSGNYQAVSPAQSVAKPKNRK